MDDIAKYNRERWKALAAANALFTRPRQNLDAEAAREFIDPDNTLGNLEGKQVLCLGGGGGQQSVAFGLLGADVTVVDLSDEQLERDRQMEAHYGFKFALHQGDMRDLSMLPERHFDVVYQPYSINFVPEVAPVFAQVSRVIKPDGIYRFMCANPVVLSVHESHWNGEGYTVRKPYRQGERIEHSDPEWVYNQPHGEVPPPVEYRHTFDSLVGGLVTNGFVILQMKEVMAYDASDQAEPGTWRHFSSILPPWLIIRTIYRSDILGVS